MKSTKRINGLYLSLVVAAVLLVVASALAFSIPGMGKYETAKVVNGAVTIPLAKVTEKATFYHLKDSGKEIAFFVVKGSDGAVHTAFDTCDVCYKAKKGYEQHGDYMTCKNCGQKFAIAKIGPHAVGGCNPSYLASIVQGANVIIKATDLRAGSNYF